MPTRGPRIVLIGRTYLAFCVLERLLERGETVAAFVGQEGGDERDFCQEMHEVCSRHSIPARSARKLGEETVRWLEDRIRPELAISVGTTFEIPLAIGGNSRLGLVELTDSSTDSDTRSVCLRRRGQETVHQEFPGLDPSCDMSDPEDEDLLAVEAMLELLEKHLGGLRGQDAGVPVEIRFQSVIGDPVQAAALRPGPGTETACLEEELAHYVSADAAIALDSVANAFTALFTALGVGPDDEVICPALVSNAAREAIEACGARAVMADVQSGCQTLDPDCARAALTTETRALLVSHPFGQPAELDALHAVAAEAGIEIVEDATAALGARFQESRIGRSPCAAVFRVPGPSPYAPGLLALPEELGEQVRASQHAEEHRLGAGLAGLAAERLRGWEDELSARRAVASRYSSELGRYDAFLVPATPAGRFPTFAAYLLRLTRFSRTSAEDLHKLMAQSGIETRMLHLGLDVHRLAELPVADQVRSHALLLPCDPQLDEGDIDTILDALFGYAIG